MAPIVQIFNVLLLVYLLGFILSLILPSIIYRDQWADDVHTIMGRVSFACMWPLLACLAALSPWIDWMDNRNNISESPINIPKVESHKKIGRGLSRFEIAKRFWNPKSRADSYGDELKLTKEENDALSRLSTLRSLVMEYGRKIFKIKERIKFLESEKRRLVLIVKHIQSERMYKLDMNKLSALGFEDME